MYMRKDIYIISLYIYIYIYIHIYIYVLVVFRVSQISPSPPEAAPMLRVVLRGAAGEVLEPIIIIIIIITINCFYY